MVFTRKQKNSILNAIKMFIYYTLSFSLISNETVFESKRQINKGERHHYTMFLDQYICNLKNPLYSTFEIFRERAFSIKDCLKEVKK